MFNFKGSNMLFSSFVCHFSKTLCSLSVPGKQEQAELHEVLRTEIMGETTCLDSLQWLSSVTFYLKDYPFCCNWWHFILFNGWVIILLKIYKHVFLQVKYPCFTRDLGPCVLPLIDSSPQVPVYEDCDMLQHHSSKASILWRSIFLMVQLSHPYMTTGKTKALTIWTFVGKVMSLLFNMLSKFVIAFLPRSKHLLIL